MPADMAGACGVPVLKKSEKIKLFKFKNNSIDNESSKKKKIFHSAKKRFNLPKLSFLIKKQRFYQ